MPEKLFHLHKVEFLVTRGILYDQLCIVYFMSRHFIF
uniref:Uncharacterized protein n=1 Tax=Anguilla anguilla TaxID=7936 RepID=A0A0E9VZV8_ANGAN